MPYTYIPLVSDADPHTCHPPTKWPGVSKRKHPDDTVWRCEDFVARFEHHSNVCGKSWRLTWVQGVPLWMELPAPQYTTPPVEGL